MKKKAKCPVCSKELILTKKGHMPVHTLNPEDLNDEEFYEYARMATRLSFDKTRKSCVGSGWLSEVKVLARFTSPDTGKNYEVREGSDGVLYCTCPSWRWPKRGQARDCKHLKDIREMMTSTEGLRRFREMQIQEGISGTV